MKKIKLNENFGKITSNDEYELDPTEKYEIPLAAWCAFPGGCKKCYTLLAFN